MIDFTPKQKKLIRMAKKGELKRINILSGSVRSGKTFCSMVLFAILVAQLPKNATALMCAKTLTALKRNCLELLQSLVGEANFSFNISTKTGKLFGRTIYLEGANDQRAEQKIRGMTLSLAYVDELTLVDAEFFQMLLSRLSVKGAKLLCSTNPDSPYSFVKKDYIDRAEELNLLYMQFSLEDNIFLDEEYVENLKKEFTGVFYRRFINGEWCSAQGVVHPQFADTPENWLKDKADDGIAWISTAIDFGGTSSGTAFVATAFYPNFSKVIVIKERMIQMPKGMIDAAHITNEFMKFINEIRTEYQAPIKYCWGDSAEQILINSIKTAIKNSGLPMQVGDSYKATIADRIMCINALMNTNRFFILRQCKELTEALRSVTFDDKSEQRGEIKMLDNGTYNIDVIDSCHYSISRFLRQLCPKH